MAQYLCICVGANWFSAMLISKWPPGSHIGIFGFWTLTLVWLWKSTAILSGTVLIYMGRSLLIFSYVAFKMAALWFWTMFNCNPPIAHCHLLLWGGGFLVDHWSTISSWKLNVVWLNFVTKLCSTLPSLLNKTSGIEIGSSHWPLWSWYMDTAEFP